MALAGRRAETRLAALAGTAGAQQEKLREEPLAAAGGASRSAPWASHLRFGGLVIAPGRLK